MQNLKIYKFIKENYEYATICDIANHGASGGYPFITYFSETTELYDEYETEIWDMLEEMKESFGHANIIELIGTFSGAKEVQNMDKFKNLLVWFAFEEICRYISENEEDKTQLKGELIV